MKKISLKLQLVLVTILSLIIALLVIVFILPNLLKPFYEKNIYEILEQPLQYITEQEHQISGGTAYLVCDFTGRVYISNNFNKILNNSSVQEVMEKITNNYGKFKINGKTYYYNTNQVQGQYFVTLCDDSYIVEQEAALNRIVLPAIFSVAVIIISILLLYSNFIVKKIARIKTKIDNIDNDNFNHKEVFEIEDELNSLMKSIEKTRKALKEKENYKNKMFQTMSHELKTPVMVISSHVEAIEDGVIDTNKGIEVIKNETNNLNQKILMMLQLNKIDYLKTSENFKIGRVDLNPVIDELVEKFEIIRNDVKFTVEKEKNSIYMGDEENWKIILNNILSNFIRFADREITITLKRDKIELGNDGEQINDNEIEKIFDIYKMGNKGNTGLGLTIVKRTLDLFGYEIKAENNKDKKGVKFVIKNRKSV